jgi:hypothetical protein
MKLAPTESLAKNVNGSLAGILLGTFVQGKVRLFGLR